MSILDTGICSPSKPVVKHKDENIYEGFLDKFDPSHNNNKDNKNNNKNNKNNQILKNLKFKDLYHEENDLFFCNKNNNINDKDCYIYNELCKDCLTLNQAYHKLKKNYLINGAGRVCTYRKGKMFCLGEFQRVYSENNIDYLLNLVCNGKIQCEPCKRMQDNMQKYYAPDLYKALILRDEKLGY